MQIVAQLTIKMNDQGQISVDGPLQNKVLCLGLLEIAKQTIHDFKEPKIVIPPPTAN